MNFTEYSSLQVHVVDWDCTSGAEAEAEAATTAQSNPVHEFVTE